MKYKRTYQQVSRLLSFIKNTAEAKRDLHGLSQADFAEMIGIPEKTYNGFVMNRTLSLNVAFLVADFIPTEVRIIYKEDYSKPLRTKEQFTEHIRDLIKRHCQTYDISQFKLGLYMNLNHNAMRNFMNRTSHSKPVMDAFLQRCGGHIVMISDMCPEDGDKIRSKKLTEINKAMRNEKEKHKEVYVSEYKKEIKERLKKLWP